MSLDATVWAWKQSLKPSEKLILLSMCDRCGEDFTCWPSQKRLEKDTGLNIKTIKKSIKRLCEMGYLSDTGQRKGKTNSVVIYKINVDHRREASPKTGALKNEDSPIFPTSESKNGLTKLAQNRAIESPIIESTNESLERESVPLDEIKLLYNQILSDVLPECLKLTDKRKKQIRACWNDDKKHQSLEFWRWYFELVKTSDFLTGKKTGFRADLDFLTNKNKMYRVIEGAYQ